MQAKNNSLTSCSTKCKSKAKQKKMSSIGPGKCLKQGNLLQFFTKITSSKILRESLPQKVQTGIPSKRKLSVYHWVMKFVSTLKKAKLIRKLKSLQLRSFASKDHTYFANNHKLTKS